MDLSGAISSAMMFRLTSGVCGRQLGRLGARPARPFVKLKRDTLMPLLSMWASSWGQ
jgi:hypothetical protein